jgi:CO/xanthine dehydrogenase FAD-binding subunit
MEIKQYFQAASLQEAYLKVTEASGNIILGGGVWMKLSTKKIDAAIGLELLALDTIEETTNSYEIGSMVTLRQLETHAGLNTLSSGILPKAAGKIMGVPFRNLATIGGSIMGKFAFSDLFAPLLVMDAALVFYKAGTMPLTEFLDQRKMNPDVLIKIIVPKTDSKGYFHKVSTTALDFATLNLAIFWEMGTIKMAIGARPSIATRTWKAENFLNRQMKPTDADIEQTVAIACDELKFGSNNKASAEYRKTLAKAYLQRGLKEVIYGED